MVKALSSQGQAAAEQAGYDFMMAVVTALKQKVAKIVLAAKRYSRPPVTQFRTRSHKNLRGDTFQDARRGCQTASTTLLPHQKGLSGGLGSDSKADVPDAMVDVRKAYHNITWASGHVINAEFGGKGTNPGNQTCLTSSANAKHAFDEAIKSAWGAMTRGFDAIHKQVMSEEAEQYLETLASRWGIKIDATVQNTAWDANYPGNCISTGIDYVVQVIGAPTSDEIARYLPDAAQSKVQAIGTLIAEVTEHLDGFWNHTVPQPMQPVPAPKVAQPVPPPQPAAAAQPTPVQPTPVQPVQPVAAESMSLPTSWSLLSEDGVVIALAAGDTVIGSGNVPATYARHGEIAAQQARISTGDSSSITNTGVNPITVDGTPLASGTSDTLVNDSGFDMAGYKFTFRAV